MAKITNDSISKKGFLTPTKKEFEALNVVLDKTEQNFKDILKLSNDIAQKTPLKGYDNIKKVQTSLDKVKNASKGLSEVEKARLQVQKQYDTTLTKLTIAQDKNTKSLISAKDSLQKQNKATKDLIKLQKAEKGSIEQLNAVNKILSSRRDKLNLSTEKGRKALKRINSALDKNNAKIRKNSDALKQQKIDIGGYKSALGGVNKALGVLGLGIIGFSAAFTTVKKVFTDVIGSTNATGDAWEQMVGGMKGSYDSLITSLARGDGWSEMFSNMKEANRLGREFVALQDTIFELTLANKLNASESTQELKELEKVYRNTNEESNKRLDALEQALALEKELADGRLVTAERVQETAIKGLSITSKIEAQEVLDWVKRQARDADKIEAANEYQKVLDNAHTKNTKLEKMTTAELGVELEKRKKQEGEITAYVTTEQKKQATLAVKTIIDARKTLATKYTDIQKNEYDEILKAQDRYQKNTNDTNVQALVDATTALDTARAADAIIEAKYASIRGTIEKRLATQAAKEDAKRAAAAKERQAALEKEFEAKKKLNMSVEKMDIKQTKNQNDLTDAILKRIDAEIEAENKVLAEKERIALEEAGVLAEQREKYEEILEASINTVNLFVEKATDHRIAQLDREIAAREKNADVIRNLGDLQNKDVAANLAYEEKAQAEAELKKVKVLRRQKLVEAGLAAFKIVGSYVDKGNPAPVATTIGDITQLIAAIPGFIDGTGEKDVSEVLGKPQLKGKDGYIIRVDGDEKILNPKASDEYDRVMASNIPKISSNALNERWQSNDMILKKFDELTNVMKNKSEYMGTDFDPMKKAITASIKRGNRIERNHVKIDM